MDSLKCELITRDFNRMLEEFSSLDPKVEFRSIVRAVAVRVIAGALRRTRSADASRIRQNHESAEFTTMDGKLYKLTNFFRNDALWHRIESKRAASLQRKLASRGLSKKSWLHQAEKLGASIDVPAYVRNANFDSREYPEDVSHIESSGAADYVLKIFNASPIVQRAGGEAALIAAMRAETRYFFTNLAKGAFRNAATRAAKYPGVYIRPQASALSA